jgi:hypothetical protein
MSRSFDSNTFRESADTFLARHILKYMLGYGFRNSIPRLRILKLFEEVPATFPPNQYEADFGILLTTSNYDHQIFFIIEIDGTVGHGTKISKIKEDERDTLFFETFGALTIRIPLLDMKHLRNLTEIKKYFDDYIFNPIEMLYINDDDFGVQRAIRDLNRKFAAKIANNNFTYCEKCPHDNECHDLTGCSYRFALYDKRICDCREAFLRSDK